LFLSVVLFSQKPKQQAEAQMKEAKMTKKDYELIADALANIGENYQGEDWTMSGALGLISEKLADALATTNPRFNRDTFLKACGVN
jgi:hypothetical protein